MKIVNIIQRYPPAVGGSETWCQEVCRYLAGKGHSVKVLTMNVNKEEEFWRDPSDEDATIKMGKLMFDEGVVVRRYARSLPIFSFYHLFLKRFLDWTLKFYFYGPHSVELYARMWREMKEADIVFLHTQPFPHNYLAFAVSRFLGKKTVIVPHFHPTHPDYERSSNYWLLGKCDRVIADTEFERGHFERKGIPPDKVRVGGVGIHPEQYVARDLADFRTRLFARYNVSPEDRLVTFIGRKMENKGVGHLIEAVKLLSDSVPVKLFLAGPSFEWFTSLYAGLTPRERERIIDVGVLDHQDKVNLLHCTDLLALPSKFEAFGIVFLEAWICGVPVLGTTEGAMPDLIGEDGYLSTFGEPANLASVIAGALADRPLLRSKGESGRKKVLERYGWNVIGKKTEEILLEVQGKRKVLVCANAYPPNFIGGAELIAHFQALALRRLGHELEVFAGNPVISLPRYSMRREVYDGIPVNRVCLHPKDYSSDYLNFYHAEVEEHFRSVLGRYAPDVVHFHNIIGLSAGLIHEAHRRGIRTVLTVHDHWGFCFKNTMIKKETDICDDISRCEECMPLINDEFRSAIPIGMRKDAIRLQLEEVDNFISPSSYLADSYVSAGVPEERFSVIPYGIDVGRYNGVHPRSSDGKVNFTFIGYLGRHKGVLTLLEAAASMKDHGTFRIHVVGTGDQLSGCREFVDRTGLTGEVRFWGHIDNSRIREVLDQTDVFVLPSIWPENQPVTITEAMAAGRAVIASGIGGIPELVEDGVTGYLFKPGDAADLKAKMEAFIHHPELIAAFGANARLKIRDNTFEKRSQDIADLYASSPVPRDAGETGPAIVACVGKSVDTDCSAAMERLSHRAPSSSYRFVMAGWLSREQILRSSLIWVVDRAARLEEVAGYLPFGKPLLVPESNEELRALCVSGNCGLIYQDAVDAAACVSYLSDNPEEARDIGIGGVEMIYGQ